MYNEVTTKLKHTRLKILSLLASFYYLLSVDIPVGHWGTYTKAQSACYAQLTCYAQLAIASNYIESVWIEISS